MQGPDPRRLALVVSEFSESGQALTKVGTGYFITDRHVLTAMHAVPQGMGATVSVRVEKGTPVWRRGGRVVWFDRRHDAALIEVVEPLPSDVEDVLWGLELPERNAEWESIAYPEASRPDSAPARKTSGLDGTLYVRGGGGQGDRELELGVEKPPKRKDWQGVSGAPVFVGDRLVGLIRSTKFEGNRFTGTPAAALHGDAGFRLAIARPWLEIPESGPWLLLLGAEDSSTEGFVRRVRASLDSHQGLEAIGKLRDRVVEVNVAEAFETPERWMQLVQAMCTAPFMIADVTGFEPGVMLALGVRAVVRRGVTVASTGHRLEDSELVALPFNVQEIKLISHGRPGASFAGDEDPTYWLNAIANALIAGALETEVNPRYLDLPAYDAVRCFPPEQAAESQAILVLCPFRQDYRDNWNNLFDALKLAYPRRQAVRMRDILSPRLVGQALYEHIRWATLCVIDWTEWRANVFFEFGVRLACAQVEPVCILQNGTPSGPLPAHTAKLIALFGPIHYDLPDVHGALAPTLHAHDARVARGSATAAWDRPDSRVPPDGTYNVCQAAFDFAQERVTAPHEFLRFANESMLGKDPQRRGQAPVLYSANAQFNAELWSAVRERWIAAWLYLRNRYERHARGTDTQYLAELKRLGETLLQHVEDDPGDPFIGALRKEVEALIRDMPNLSPGIMELKTQAKNRRDSQLWGEAVDLIREAIALAQREYESARTIEWRRRILPELVDCWGMLGGLERRWALDSAIGSATREQHLERSIAAYETGYGHERALLGDDSGPYTRLNRLLVRLLRMPNLLDGDGDGAAVREELAAIAEQRRGPAESDLWAAADFALINLLLGRADGDSAYALFEKLNPPDYARRSVLDVIGALAQLDLPTAPALRVAYRRLETRPG